MLEWTCAIATCGVRVFAAAAYAKSETHMSATISTAGVDEVLKFMSQGSAYSDHPSSVQIVETHISWVFLTNQYVSKLKKNGEV